MSNADRLRKELKGSLKKIITLDDDSSVLVQQGKGIEIKISKQKNSQIVKITDDEWQENSRKLKTHQIIYDKKTKRLMAKKKINPKQNDIIKSDKGK